MKENMNNKSKRLNQIDGFRAILITMIIITHLEFLKDYPYGTLYECFFHGANLAVNLFFMISGFGLLISNISKSQESSFRKNVLFSIKKIKKIYPTYLLSLIILVPYEIIKMHKIGLSIKEIFIKISSNFTMCLTLLQSSTAMTKYSHAINDVCWFLSTLFIIYFFCPIIIKFIKKYICTLKRSLIAFFVNIGIILLLNMLNISLTKYTTIFDDFFYGSPYVRIFYVSLGMLLGNTYVLTKDSVLKLNFLDITSFSVFIAYYLIRNSLNINEFLKLTLDLIICSQIILILAYNIGLSSKLLSNNLFIIVGKNSMYPFLLHYPIRKYIKTLFEIKQINLGYWTGIYEAIIIIVLTIIISIIWYKFLNMNFFTYVKKTKQRKNPSV